MSLAITPPPKHGTNIKFFFVLNGQIKLNLGPNKLATEVDWGQRTGQQFHNYVNCTIYNTALSTFLLWYPVCLLSGHFFRAKMQFRSMEVKIAIDAWKCSNISYFLLAHLPSSPSSLPLYTSQDLHTLHLLDKFMKGTSGNDSFDTIDTSDSIEGRTLLTLVTVMTMVPSQTNLVRTIFFVSKSLWLKKSLLIKKIKTKKSFWTQKNLKMKIITKPFLWLNKFCHSSDSSNIDGSNSER